MLAATDPNTDMGKTLTEGGLGWWCESSHTAAFAALVEKAERDGGGSLAFVIGGSDGLCEEVKQECAFRLSFSKMTFPHQLMRVILFEQIYRAYMINSNRTYHK